MKNQYFGDKRDLFKFDLLLDVMASCGFEQLSYVPMLTPSVSISNEGKQRLASAGRFNSEVFEFLRRHRSAADIRELRKFFAARPQFRYAAHRDDAHYSYEGRKAYFQSIGAKDLRAACVFIDPDVGIERGSLADMQKRGIDKYLFIDDLALLAGRCTDSAIIVYQHLQKDASKRLGDITSHVRLLMERMDLAAVPFVRHHDLAFYAICSQEDLVRRVAGVFFAYAGKLAKAREHVTDMLQVAKGLAGEHPGVADLAVFGSVARGEHTGTSDIDVMVRFARPGTLRGYFDLQRRLELMLGRRVDLVTDKAVRSEMMQVIEREALHAA